MVDLEKHLAKIQREQLKQLGRLVNQHAELADKKAAAGKDPLPDLLQGAEAARRAHQIVTEELIIPKE